MKVLLLEDVYNLGRAGDVKKVANGYGRNYLIPKGLAVLATPGALKQVEQIRTTASVRRAVLNEEMSGLAEILEGSVFTFAAKAGDTGKLYGSITSQMIADAIEEKTGMQFDRRQLDVQPIRMIGEHKLNVRLTMDLVPEITVIVYKEGEAIITVEGAPAGETEEAPSLEVEPITEEEAEPAIEEMVTEAAEQE